MKSPFKKLPTIQTKNQQTPIRINRKSPVLNNLDRSLLNKSEIIPNKTPEKNIKFENKNRNNIPLNKNRDYSFEKDHQSHHVYKQIQLENCKKEKEISFKTRIKALIKEDKYKPISPEIGSFFNKFIGQFKTDSEKPIFEKTSKQKLQQDLYKDFKERRRKLDLNISEDKEDKEDRDSSKELEVVHETVKKLQVKKISNSFTFNPGKLKKQETPHFSFERSSEKSFKQLRHRQETFNKISENSLEVDQEEDNDSSNNSLKGISTLMYKNSLNNILKIEKPLSLNLSNNKKKPLEINNSLSLSILKTEPKPDTNSNSNIKRDSVKDTTATPIDTLKEV
jgi:hypothetical protein